MRQKKYSAGTLCDAVKRIRRGSISAYKAHKEYGIPKSTLSCKIRDQHSKIYGRESILSSTHEKQLAEWIILCASSGCPKTSLEIREAASELAKLGGKSFKGGLPTIGWLRRFLKRHPHISKHTPETLGKVSAGLTPDRIKRYFEFLQNQFEQSNMLHLLEQPESWWNVDETNFVQNPVPKKVYARKGSKIVYNVERGKPTENITCTYAVAADGNYIPPLITFKESFSGIVEATTVSGSNGANFGFNKTASGWMKGDAFFYFVTQHLNPRWNEMGIPHPVVLVVDGYSGHHSLKLYKWCCENEVLLVILYPNATHILQVLDVAVFGPIKAKYSDLFQKSKHENPGKTFNEVDFVKLLKRTNDEVLKVETIVNGWRSTGLQPFYFDNLKTNRFLTGLTGYNKENQDTNNRPDPPMVMIPIDSTPSTSGFGFDLIASSSREIPTMLNDDLDQIELSSSLVESVQEVSSIRTENESIAFECDLSMKNRTNEISNISSIDRETIQMVSKVRDDLNGLRAHLKVHEPSKLINILIMEQQLNIIEPIIPEMMVPVTPNVRTSSDILQIPSNVKTTRKRKGIKISYGVMSDKQIIEEMEQREKDESKLAEEQRADETAKAEKARILKEAKEELAKETERLKTARNHLKTLEAEATAERKKVAAKRKSQQEKLKKSKQLVTAETKPLTKRVRKVVI